MTDKELKAKILAGIERLFNDRPMQGKSEYGYDCALRDVKKFINSFPEEPVSEELEDAAIEICSEIVKGKTVIIDGYEYVVLSDAEECFKAGAQWQKEMECNTKMQIHKKAVEYGKQQMIEKACDYLKEHTLLSNLTIDDFRKALEE